MATALTVAESLPDGLQLRRTVAMAVLTVVLANEVAATGLLSLDERYVAASRNVVFPGLGLIEWNLPVAGLLAFAGVWALVCWLRWGMDWAVAAIWGAGLLAAALLVPAAHSHVHGAAATVPPATVRASHSMGAVVAAIVILNWASLWIAGLPGMRWLARHFGKPGARGLTSVAGGRSVERARVGAVVALSRMAGNDPPEGAIVSMALAAASVDRRARVVGICARLRVRGDPLRRDNAHIRAARLLSCQLPEGSVGDFRQECRGQFAGVPASEPGWLRPLDGMLAAVALQALGEHECVERWRACFQTRFRLKHGHRPACLYTPLAVAAGSAADWEQAAATAIGHAFGWLGADDWRPLRKRAFAAAARGTGLARDERLVAAGRLWAVQLDDAQALQVLGRPSIVKDPMAVALDALAAALKANPADLRSRTPMRA